MRLQLRRKIAGNREVGEMDYKGIGDGIEAAIKAAEKLAKIRCYLLLLLIPLAIFGAWKLVDLVVWIFT